MENTEDKSRDRPLLKKRRVSDGVLIDIEVALNLVRRFLPVWRDEA